jgi:hypothetical protein
LIKIESLLSSEVFRGGVSSFDEPLDEYSDELCDEEKGKLDEELSCFEEVKSVSNQRR